MTMARHFNLYLRTSRVFLVPFFAASLTITGLSLAQGHGTEFKMTLRTIMQGLGAEYLRLTYALLIEDFKGLEQSAKAIQGHPLPDDVIAAIKGKLGDRFHEFEMADDLSHRAAAILADRAAANDISGSAQVFGRLTESCVSCHSQFRETLRGLSAAR